MPGWKKLRSNIIVSNEVVTCLKMRRTFTSDVKHIVAETVHA